MKNSTKFIGVIFGILLLSSILALSGAFNYSSNDATNSDASIKYNSNVCSYITRTDGTIEDNGCSHNLLTNFGKNMIRASLTSANGVAVSYIGLCNATAGCNATNVADGGLYNEFTNSGLNRTNEATLLNLGTGNWSYSRTFVASADNLVTNKTGIFNASSGDTMLAENTFTTSTLQTNDQITINWSIWVD